jgi:DNA repair exonuclease SbcCD ATPase subunit
MGENFSPSEAPGAGRRFARFVYRLLRALIVLLLLLGLLAGIAWGGLWLYQTVSGEINRSADSVATRFEAQESRIDLLRREVDGLLANNPGQDEQLRELQRRVNSLESSLSQLSRDLERKDTLLAAFAADLADNQANDALAAEAITDLADGLSALQADFNVSTGQVDALGGELDGLVLQVGQIEAGLAAAVAAAEIASAQADQAATAVSEMAHSFILFHSWELIARARLHLLSGNIGLAAADVRAAQQTLITLQAQLSAESDLADDLTILQTRLNLAADNLPGAPDLAIRDLENAWDVLDQLLVGRLLPEEEAASPETEAAEEAEPTATPPAP